LTIDTIDTLNQLIETARDGKDGKQGFLSSAEYVRSPELRELFRAVLKTAGKPRWHDENRWPRICSLGHRYWLKSSQQLSGPNRGETG